MTDEKRVSDEFPELFHYTNISAFENIYKTRQFWATHYQDLNDLTEFTRFRLRVREFIHPIVLSIFKKQIRDNTAFATAVDKHGGIDVVVDSEVDDLLDTVHRRTFGKEMYKETFIFSFCGHRLPYEASHGLLSQWRAYSADGGVAIVFNTAAVEQMMHDEYDHRVQLQLMHVGTVEYDSPGQESEIRIRKRFKAVFDHLPDIAKRWYPDDGVYNKIALASAFERIHGDFVLGTTLVKHHAFHEENEIRIVVSPKTDDSYSQYDPDNPRLRMDILYRPAARTHEARYVKLFGELVLPIERIIVGPSRIQNLNYQKIRDVVGTPAKIVRSEIPFSG